MMLIVAIGYFAGCSETNFEGRALNSSKSDKATPKSDDGRPDDGADGPGDNEPSEGAEDGMLGKSDDGEEDLDPSLGSDEEDAFPTGDDIIVDSDTVESTPGKIVTSLGIHFEDGKDNDFNDLSVCMKGKFKVDGANVVSLGKQTAVLKVMRISGMPHTYIIETSKKNGDSIDQFTSTPAASVEVEHRSKIFAGSKLKVQTTAAKPGTIDMSHATRARIELDECRNTGN